MASKISPDDLMLWSAFIERHQLTDQQVNQFRAFYQMLLKTNDIHNLTAITNLEKVLADHFDDSLALANAINISSLSSLGDIGSGGGFPALPLKILYPHLKMVLIEVNNKKIAFLEEVIEHLGLTDVIVDGHDWRNFLRETQYPIELFCARASLQPEELIRMFKPACPYKNASLVYWASRHWEPSARVEPYIKEDHWYTVDEKKRRLVFFSVY